jgi:hypothetical protein
VDLMSDASVIHMMIWLIKKQGLFYKKKSMQKLITMINSISSKLSLEQTVMV